MRKISIYTLGCRLNQCESEAIADSFKNANFEVVSPSEVCDVYVVNTCTVTTKAEQKARRMIRKFARQDNYPLVVVTGCYAQMDGEFLSTLAENVLVCSLEHKSHLLDLPLYLNGQKNLIEGSRKFFMENKGINTKNVFAYDASQFSYHSRAYLKIQDGCDNNCGFCRVHVARGKSTFLGHDELIERALKLESEGFNEIMLTGVNLTMYDHDGEKLGIAVEKLLKALGPNIRLRFSSLEPDHVDDKLLECFKDPRVQPHFHIPVQTASNRLLDYINRTHHVEIAQELIVKLRSIKDDPFIACDIITGLPTESDEDFDATMKFVENYDISQVHVFPYSERPQTDLFKAKGQVTQSIRDERARKLRGLSEILHRRYINRHIGKTVEIIAEHNKDDIWFGLTGNYIEAKLIPGNTEIVRGGIYKAILDNDSKLGIVARIIG